MISKRSLMLAARGLAGSMLVKAGIMMLGETLIVMAPPDKHNESTWWIRPWTRPRKDTRLTALRPLKRVW